VGVYITFKSITLRKLKHNISKFICCGKRNHAGIIEKMEKWLSLHFSYCMVQRESKVTGAIF